MKKIHAQADLSGWLSPDEMRLLDLYRDGSEQMRDEWLYSITRRHLVHIFAENFEDARDGKDTTYLHEELEQWLREICPFHRLGSFYGEEPQCSALVATAWGAAGRVVLGSSAHDGQRADELCHAAVRLWDAVGDAPERRQPLRLDRKGALTFLEAWREEALSFAFNADEEDRP